MPMSIMNLIVVAHPDDEILGFGGTGARLVQAGENVQAVILCGDVDARTRRPTNAELAEDIQQANSLVGFASPVLGAFPNIRMNAVPHLDLVRFIEDQIERLLPTRIFTHHPGDLNNDHLHVATACMAAARLFQRRQDLPPLKSLHFMEIPSSTDWSFPGSGTPFIPNLYMEIGAELEAKIQALGCYRMVMREAPHPRSREALMGLAAYRGGQAGYHYAEAFQTVFQRGM